MKKPKSQTPTPPPPLIVAVGASAGGLEAFQELLASIGDAQQMAIVFVQHLDPKSESLLAELLTKTTTMKVVEITGRRKLKPSTVYLCPPQTLLDIKNGFVSISQDNNENNIRPTLPIDHFFHSVAEDQRERGVGVILSGAGTDGTLGLKAISDRGGLTFAQEASSAKYDSMPRSAATTGVADHVLPPAEIANELLQYAQHLIDSEAPATIKRKQTDIKEAIPVIAERLLEVTQHNFQHYKVNTLTRRIGRRMQVLKIASVSDYVDCLQHNEDEVRLLFRELLIGVTAFFRDPEAFDQLKQSVLPKLFESRVSDDCVRIWVAGCASGQEAYTMAILCREVMDEIASPCEVQIFATDIDERALSVARAGAYPVGIEEQISPERLKRFFIKRGKKYHVSKEIREIVLFSAHNLISDPPFSRQDLISCRNLLIYLGPHLQNKLIPLFHYALRPSGFLLLGPSENITSHGELFRPLDAKHRISQRKGTGIGTSGASQYRPSPMATRQGRHTEPDSGTDLSEIRMRITLDEFAPKSVVIDEDGQILNSSPDMQKYLTVSGGNYQNNIIKMAARGLRLGLRAAFAEAKKTTRRVDHENLSVRVGEQTQRVTITVQPMPRLGEDESLFMVVFHDVGKPFKRDEAENPNTTLTVEMGDDDMVMQLERELETTRDDLDKTLQDMEAANEELKSSNEELLSMNEELQSANEELETSKEEIRTSSDATARANADLENLLQSTQIATVFLDEELNIRSFTPAIGDVYSLIATDVGRPLERFVPLVQQMPPLPDPKKIKRGEMMEDTVFADSGKSYIRRVLPYRSHTGESEGIVVTFTDVTELQESEQRFRATFENAAVGIAHVGLDGSWLRVNDRLCEIVGYNRDELLQKTFQDITHPDDLDHDLQHLQALVAGKTISYVIEKRYFRSGGEIVWIRLTVSAVRDHLGQPVHFISIVEDITDAKGTEHALADAKTRLELSLEIGSIAPWNWNMQTGDVVANPMLNRLFGFADSDSPLSADYVARINHEERERISAAVERSIQTGEPYQEEYKILLPTGEQRFVRARGEVRLSSTGEAEDFFGVIIDITERKHREIELAGREAHLRRVINNQLGLVGVIDRDGILLEVDDRSLEIARTAREEVIGKHFADAPWWNYDPAVADQMRDAMQRAFAGEIVRHDVSLFSHGDEGVMIDFMIAPVKNEAGEVEYLIPSGVDIRDRKAFESRLKASEARFRTMADGMPLLVWVHDEEGKQVTVNRAFCEFYNVEESQMRDMKWHELAHPDDFNSYAEEFARCVAEQCPFHAEVRVKRADGQLRWLESWGEPHFSESEKYLGHIGASADVTDRKADELQLKVFNAKLGAVFQQSPYLEGVISLDGILTEINEATALPNGYTDDQFLNQLFWETPFFDGQPELQTLIRDNFNLAVKGTPFQQTISFTLSHGSRGYFDFAFTPAWDDDGNVMFIIATASNVTDRVETQLRLEELVKKHRHTKVELALAARAAVAANEAKSAFLANMSHEIRTPMTAILGYADLVRDLIDEPEAIQHLQTIRRNGDYLLDIINDILDLSKIEAGKFEIERERFEPAKLIEDVRSVMEVRAVENGLSLEVEYDGNLPKVIESDGKRLKQILINLIGNAIKFTKAGRVRIRVRYVAPVVSTGDPADAFETNSATLHFDIVDTGIGMSDEQLERLFKPFSQGDSSVSRHFGGTGLGLAISQRLAEMLGGKIEVSSTQGVGSTFTVSIATGDLKDVPMVDYAESKRHERESAAGDSETITLSCRVLVVDDRRDIRFLSKRLLTQAGATVDECEDGQLAVDHITACLNVVDEVTSPSPGVVDDLTSPSQGAINEITSPRQPPDERTRSLVHYLPDLILLDMQMPNLDGYQTARALRKLGYTGPIIALTADAMQGDMNECLEAGCNGYLSKPIDAELLIRKIYSFTSQSEKLQGEG